MEARSPGTYYVVKNVIKNQKQEFYVYISSVLINISKEELFNT